MARLPLVYYPDKVLKVRAAEITEINQEIADLVRDMAETMYASSGIGLAAPQVDRSLRLMTVDVDPDEDGASLMHFINPVIVEAHGRTTYEEGCLSFPGITADVKRRDSIRVQAFDVSGSPIDLEADGLLSICIQHELDHLNGITFVDRLNPVQKKLVLRRYLRLREEDEEDAAMDAIRAVHE